jgi:uncharacterized protein (DUF433 family)
MDIKEYIAIDPDVLGGRPVFKGTLVPVQTLFDHLEAGVSLDEFLDDFETVTKEQAIGVLEVASRFVTSGNIAALYETA